MDSSGNACIFRCVGCETQGRPGGRDGQVVQHRSSGNRRRRQRLVGAAAAFERREVQRELHGVVRSTGRQARAAVSALVRAPVHGAVREPVDGEADTGGARSAAATSAVRSAGARRTGRLAGRFGRTKHRRVGPATAGSAASRRASGARSERSERRREGYPPEGSRPRSGLGRVARSRSDAPSLIPWSRDIVSMFGTIDCIIDCTVVSSIGGRVSDGIGITTIGAGIVNTIGIGAGPRRTLLASVARCCGGQAAEPPRSAAPQATREAKAGVAAVAVSDQKGGPRRRSGDAARGGAAAQAATR